MSLPGQSTVLVERAQNKPTSRTQDENFVACADMTARSGRHQAHANDGERNRKNGGRTEWLPNHAA